MRSVDSRAPAIATIVATPLIALLQGFGNSQALIAIDYIGRFSLNTTPDRGIKALRSVYEVAARWHRRPDTPFHQEHTSLRISPPFFGGLFLVDARW
jgi:hypothetical protein